MGQPRETKISVSEPPLSDALVIANLESRDQIERELGIPDDTGAAPPAAALEPVAPSAPETPPPAATEQPQPEQPQPESLPQSPATRLKDCVHRFFDAIPKSNLDQLLNLGTDVMAMTRRQEGFIKRVGAVKAPGVQTSYGE